MDPAHRASLRSLHSSELESLRAGAPALLPALKLDERSALRLAESRSRDLSKLRAGTLSDREWTLIVVGAAVIILLIAIS
jgi:hypothetical protein